MVGVNFRITHCFICLGVIIGLRVDRGLRTSINRYPAVLLDILEVFARAKGEYSGIVFG